MSDLHKALQKLNRAAYAAQMAGRDTRLYPHLDRRSILEICHATDKLVDDNAPSIPITPRAADHGASLTGGQASARAESPAGPSSFPNAAPTHGHAAVTGGGFSSQTHPKPAAGDLEDDGFETVHVSPPAEPRNHAEEIANAMAHARMQKRLDEDRS